LRLSVVELLVVGVAAGVLELFQLSPLGYRRARMIPAHPLSSTLPFQEIDYDDLMEDEDDEV